MPANLQPTADLLTNEEIASEFLLMKELFVTSFFPDSIYSKWLAEQKNKFLSPRYKLTKEELDFLLDFSRKILAIVCPDGFPDQDKIGSLRKEIGTVEAQLTQLKREDDEKSYEQLKDKLHKLSTQIKTEEWKLNFYNEYKEAFLGANKATGKTKEANTTIRVLGLIDDDITGLKLLLDKSENKYLNDDENRHKKLKNLFSQNFHHLYGIAIKFNNYRTDKIVNVDVKNKYVKAEVSKNPRRHPLFPTVAEAKADKSEVFSDHLPILVKTPSLNIISLNVLGPGVAASGFHAQRGWETDLEAKFRYSQIIDGFLKGIEKHKVDVIALQEATASFIFPILKAKLGLKWEIIADEHTGIITCYNKERFDCVKTSLDDRTERIRSIHLRDKNTNEEMEVHNVWGNYNPFPYEAEEVYKKLLLGKKHLSVVVGDTNLRIVPTHNQKCNPTTGVVPIGLNQLNEAEEELQITDYPDGAFCCLGDNKIIQLENHVLDYRSAEIIVDNRPVEELQSWPEFRIVLCLADEYKELKVINNSSIFEYQKQLIRSIGDEKLKVRMAADSINQKAIAIRFTPDSKLYEFLKQKLNNESGFQLRKIANTSMHDGTVYPVIFAPLEKSVLLHEAIASYLLNNTLKIRKKEKTYYNQNLSIFASEIVKMATQQPVLLEKISQLPPKTKMLEEYKRFPYLYAQQIEQENNFIKMNVKVALNRIHRLKDFVDACPDVLHYYRHTLFSHRQKISEKEIADNHLLKFISELSNQVRNLIIEEFNILNIEFLSTPPFFIIEKAINLIINTAKKDILQLHSDQHASLKKDSYITLLMLYVKELQEDLTKFHDANRKSVDELTIVKRFLPLNEEITDDEIASDFKAIQQNREKLRTFRP